MLFRLVSLGLILLIQLSMEVKAQLPQFRGFYVDHFVSQILGNPIAEERLLDYIDYHGFNSITLYELSMIDYSNSSQVQNLANFIGEARQRGVERVGASSEIYSFLKNEIMNYNATHPAHQSFDVLNFEFEFWVPHSVQAGGIYCTTYLQPNGFSCNQSGAFSFYMRELKDIYNLAQQKGLETEVYLGWFSQDQINQILAYTDRVLLHAYVQSPENAFGYSRERLEMIENYGKEIEVIGLFSAEMEFYRTWLDQNEYDYELAYTIYHDDLVAHRNWQNVEENGMQWFAYTHMPWDNKNQMDTEDPDALLALQLAPNPAQDWVRIVGDDTGLERIVLVDALGRKVVELPYQSTFSVQHLEKGVYFVQLIGQPKIHRLKLIKN